MCVRAFAALRESNRTDQRRYDILGVTRAQLENPKHHGARFTGSVLLNFIQDVVEKYIQDSRLAGGDAGAGGGGGGSEPVSLAELEMRSRREAAAAAVAAATGGRGATNKQGSRKVRSVIPCLVGHLLDTSCCCCCWNVPTMGRTDVHDGVIVVDTFCHPTLSNC